MSTKRNERKKTGSAPQAVDPRAAVQITPVSLRETMTEMRRIAERLAPPEKPGPNDLVYAMLHFFFADGLPDGYGQEAVRRLEENFVDRNELRVTEAYEVAELMEDLGIPDLLERSANARSAVAQLYNDQNLVSLEFLREASVAERNQFLARVPAITPSVSRFLLALTTFEECVFSPRSTVRAQLRFGFDPKSAPAQEFLEEVRQLFTPFGHLPLLVGPHQPGTVVVDPPLSPASLALRLGLGKKK